MTASQGQFCQHCNAWRGSLGLEPTPELYVSHLVSVFREVKRVLRDDGTVWLNLGDSYTSSGRSSRKESPGVGAKQAMKAPGRTLNWKAGGDSNFSWTIPSFGTNLKPKDLVGIPWRVAFALQADGWWLRSDIIWHKPNCMPESVTDRPTKAHEYLFLLTKRARYYYDAEAVREANLTTGGKTWAERRNSEPSRRGLDVDTYPPMPSMARNPAGRNRRTVWTIPTQSYKGAHFATFPEKLVEPCILAGTSAKGECPECGLGWKRVVERSATNHKDRADRQIATGGAITGGVGKNFPDVTTTTTGWTPQCPCHDADGNPHAPVPQTVLDIFAGTATVGKVAAQHRRAFVGLELNPDYISLATKRTRNVAVRLAL